MIVWDTGVWAPMDDVEKSLKTGAFKFRLAGEKLNGGWMLARLKPKEQGESKKNWLLFKERDPAADAKLDILEARPESVKIRPADRGARRTAEEAGGPQTGGAAAEARSGSAQRRRRGSRPGAHPAATRHTDDAAAGERGHAGTLAARDQVRRLPHHGACLARRGQADHPQRPRLDEALRRPAGGLRQLPCREAIIDGEIVVLDDKGISRFALLQDALSEGAGNKLVFYAFDLLYLDGWDLAASAARQPQGAALAAAGRPGRQPLGDPAQRPCRRRRQGALRAGVRAGARRHRLEARLGALPERPLEDLDQDQGAC